jgi:hypothetical protein
MDPELREIIFDHCCVSPVLSSFGLIGPEMVEKFGALMSVIRWV